MVTRTQKIYTVKVTAVDVLNRRFPEFTVTVSDLGKTESVNVRKIKNALMDVESYKPSYSFGTWEIVSVHETVRAMTDALWLQMSKVISIDGVPILDPEADDADEAEAEA